MFGPLKFLLFACVFPFISAQENSLKNTLKQFQCGDSKQSVPYAFVCDGEKDCQNGQDETRALCNQTRECSNEQFKCNNGLCISKNWLCDNQNDCSDGSDENEDNCWKQKCNSGQFACKKDGQCIPKSWQCDGYTHCQDGSDEFNCTQTCGDKQYTCQNGRCIDQALACNGFDDCGDKTDELNCSKKQCTRNEFTCKNRECVPIQWRCDGRADCFDKSDEVNCKNSTMYHCDQSIEDCLNNPKCMSQQWICDGVENCMNGMDESPMLCNKSFACPPNYFQCTDGVCIPDSMRCSGTYECPDFSDELNCSAKKCDANTHFDCGNNTCIPFKDLCHRQDECANFGKAQQEYCASSCNQCDQSCIVTPKGHYCACEPGFRPLNNGRNCVDINECEIPGTCSQKCTNTIGSYSCQCEAGYTKDSKDPSRCVAANRPYLLIASNSKIVNVSTEYDPIRSISERLVNANGVDYHYNEKLIFWSDIDQKTIYKRDATGQETAIITQVTAEDIAVDHVHKNIYWTDSGSGTIEMCNFHGNNRIILLNKLLLPRAISIDAVNAWIFWSSWGEYPKIERAGLDGSSRTTLVQNRIGWPNGIAVEPTNGRIYWTDAKEHKLFSANYFGGERRIIPIEAHYLKHPYSIATFEDVVYWSDWDLSAIYKTNKFTGGRVDMVTPMESHVSPRSIKVYHEYVQPHMENPCEIMQCSHVCLQNAKKLHYCACPAHQKLSTDGKTCVEVTTYSVRTSLRTDGTSVFEDTTTEGSTTKAAISDTGNIVEIETNEVNYWYIGIACAGIVLLAVLCTYFYKCAKKILNKDKMSIDFTTKNRKIEDGGKLLPRLMENGDLKSITTDELKPFNDVV